MVVVVFWFTSGAASPNDKGLHAFETLGVGIATIAAGLLIYETYQWLLGMLSGLSILEQDKKLHLLSFPLQSLCCSALTSIILVPQLRRALGQSAGALLFVAALPTGFAAYGLNLLNIDYWNSHWLASSIGLFETIILPLILAAIAQRLSPSRDSVGAAAKMTNHSRSATVPPWIGVFLVYPVTILVVVWLRDEWIHVRGLAIPTWGNDFARATVWAALILSLSAGSIVTWQSLSTSKNARARYAFLIRLTVVVIATPFILVTATSDGFITGQVFNDSAKRTLGRPYKINLNASGSELSFSGSVTYGLADELDAQLSAHPHIRQIKLDSPGGLLLEGRHASRIIQAHELDTLVTGECSSSCTLMFLAGKTRSLGPDGRLGFHGASSPMPNESAAGVFLRAYGPFDLEPSFLAQVEATKPPALWYPERSELVTAHVLSSAAPEISSH
jgi:hypothetical protein